jgi:hypothetical protein
VSGEREPGQYTFETLDVLLELAEEVGLQVHTCVSDRITV